MTDLKEFRAQKQTERDLLQRALDVPEEDPFPAGVAALQRGIAECDQILAILDLIDQARDLLAQWMVSRDTGQTPPWTGTALWGGWPEGWTYDDALDAFKKARGG